MTMSEVLSAAGAGGVQLDNHIFLHPDDVSEGPDRGEGCADQIRNQQSLKDQPAGSLSALQQIQWVCEKAGLDVPTTVLEAAYMQVYISDEINWIFEIEAWVHVSCGMSTDSAMLRKEQCCH